MTKDLIEVDNLWKQVRLARVGEVEEIFELSINLVVVFSARKNMKRKGVVNHRDVLVMVDCETTHNFISRRLVQQLNLPLKPTAGYKVLMSSGLVVKGKGICMGIMVILQNVEIAEDFSPLGLGQHRHH